MLRTKLSLLSVMVAATLLSGCNDDEIIYQSVVEATPSTDDAAEAEVVFDSLEAQALDIVSKLTTEEKLKLVIGPGFFSAPDNLKASVAGTVGYVNGVLNTETGVDVAATKLMDGPAGVRITPTIAGDPDTYYATNFPSGTVLASTWNTDLVNEVATAAGEEGKEYGVDIWLAPGMNIQRHPLAGRNFEYFSEDPLVSGMMGAAVVNGAQSQGVGTTIKHYVANNSETNRRTANTVITPRALREIYMRGFQYTVEHAQPWAMMSSYNSVNGENTGERFDIMTTVARDEWGFNGFIMSDWWAGWNPVAMLEAGVDVIEPGGQWRFGHSDDWNPYLVEAYERGELTDEVLDRNIVRILKTVLKTPSALGYDFSRKPDLAAHAAVALKAAEEGIVMLKNDSALPLQTTQTIASFGTGQYGTLPVGGGSGSVNAAHIVSINEGLKAEGFTLQPDLDLIYEGAFNSAALEGSIDHDASTFNQDKYCEGGSGAGETNLGGLFAVCREMTLTTDQINAAVTASNAAVITITRNTAEGTENPESTDELINPMSEGYYLNAVELSLIERVSTVARSQSKPVIVILNVGNSIDTAAWRDQVDGILVTYLPGQEAGTAVANIISGEVNPSGKLAQTFPMSLTQVSSYSNDEGSFPGMYIDGNQYNAGPDDVPELNYDDQVLADDDHRDFNQYYDDDIYVGYRYNTTFNVTPAYAFGFGLSYTAFDFTNSTLVANTLNRHDDDQGIVTIKTTVNNTGDVAGKQVVQAYVHAPAGALAKPQIELKAFAKTGLIAAGGSEVVSMTIPAKDLASFNPTLNQWVVEPGSYSIYVSASSDVTGVSPVTFNVEELVVVSDTTPGILELQEQYADDLEARMISKGTN